MNFTTSPFYIENEAGIYSLYLRGKNEKGETTYTLQGETYPTLAKALKTAGYKGAVGQILQKIKKRERKAK